MGRIYKTIDLFAGIGGIRLGFEKAFGNQMETVFVSEWDEHAQKTYRANFKDKFEIAGDITQINEKDVPNFDICLAGFPCQAFSMAGKRQGFNDDYKGLCRGTLFLDVARICEEHKPAVIFCENVKGLAIHDRGRTLQIIKKTFEDLGYKVFSEILNSKDFGVPQNRERIYIVAFRCDIAPENFISPRKTDDSKRISDILENEPVSPKYYLSDVYLNTLKRHKERHAAKGNGFGYEIRSLDGIAGAIVCGGMGRERNLIVDKRQTELIPVTHIKGNINTEGIRKMTPREWARLQGYPDTFKLELADTHLYKQLGNSVTVPVIEAIAKKIKEVLDNNNKQLSGNKGEWSEIYTFLKLLGDGKLYGADGELNKKEDIFYDILKIIRNEQIGTLHFVFDSINRVVDVQKEDGSTQVSVSADILKSQAEYLYDKIVSAKGTAAFKVIEINDFLKDILCSKLKAPSEDKSDITIMVHDFNTGLNPTLGFSIKSRLGKPSTLLNAGANTNFIFEIQGNITDEDMECINTFFVDKKKNGKIKQDISVSLRMDYIQSKGFRLVYHDMVGKTFKNNLTLIDTDLPDIVGYMMLEYYLKGKNNILDALNAVAKNNPMDYDLSEGHEYYRYKLKKMLTESALGMLPGKVWTGKADANGGYIIVREDGEVLCYHLYNRNEFEDYLLNNTRFDRGGAGRHNYAIVEKKNDKYYIKLNLQIRFIK